MPLPKPINETQRRFHELCRLGGGRGGGPARTKVQELLHWSGSSLNSIGRREIADHLAAYPDFNPWHVCYAMGLSWGHFAPINLEFTGAAAWLMSDWNGDDLAIARRHHFERGPDPVEESLSGGHTLFSKVRLPDELPNTLNGYRDAQQRWLGAIISRDRPRYIGSWNATAMFMVALFSNPGLADTLTTPIVLLPPGGPIFNALAILHQTKVLSRPPSGTELDDEAFEPGALYENNALIEELHKGHAGWNLLDVHSGLYMLGTRLPQSDTWF